MYMINTEINEDAINVIDTRKNVEDVSRCIAESYVYNAIDTPFRDEVMDDIFIMLSSNYGLYELLTTDFDDEINVELTKDYRNRIMENYADYFADDFDESQLDDFFDGLTINKLSLLVYSTNPDRFAEFEDYIEKNVEQECIKADAVLSYDFNVKVELSVNGDYTDDAIKRKLHHRFGAKAIRRWRTCSVDSIIIINNDNVHYVTMNLHVNGTHLYTKESVEKGVINRIGEKARWGEWSACELKNVTATQI